MEASLSTLLHYLPERFEVTLLATDREVAEAIATARPGIDVRVVAAVRSKHDASGIVTQVRTMRSIRPDVVHVNLGQVWKGQYGLLAGVLLCLPTLAVVHGVVASSGRLQVAAFRALARRVDMYAGVSKSVCDETEVALKLPRGTTRLAYNGVAGATLRGSRGSLQTIQPRPGERVVGAIGRLRAEKGYDDLLHALTSVPNAKALIIGEGEERDYLAALAERLRIVERLSMPGWRDDPWSASAPFDVLAVPSRVEGFGLVAVEAMLRGVPVVAYRVGGLPEVIDDGVTGLLVAPGDVAGLAKALRSLLADPDRRAAMGEAGRKAALARFSVTAMVRSHVALLDELTQDHRVGRRFGRTTVPRSDAMPAYKPLTDPAGVDMGPPDRPRTRHARGWWLRRRLLAPSRTVIVIGAIILGEMCRPRG